jgi:hypothetical protein
MEDEMTFLSCFEDGTNEGQPEVQFPLELHATKNFAPHDQNNWSVI